MLEIGKALTFRPEILILDEPTASLTRREIEQLFVLVKRMRDGGTAILFVTHHLREVLEIADHVSIMRDGKIVASRAVTREMTEADLIELLIGKTAQLQPAAPAKSASMPLLEVSELSTSSSQRRFIPHRSGRDRRPLRRCRLRARGDRPRPRRITSRKWRHGQTLGSDLQSAQPGSRSWCGNWLSAL